MLPALFFRSSTFPQPRPMLSLNYFWLSFDPRESASWYCDQHCFKIHTEIIESVWDSVLSLAPWVEDWANQSGISKTYRNRRHSKPGTKWHPLSKWTGLCRGNALTSLINARALLEEHRHRTGKKHTVWKDWHFLWGILPLVRYSPYDAEVEPHEKSNHDQFLEVHFSGSSRSSLFKKFRPVPVIWFPSRGVSSLEIFYTEPPRCFGKYQPDGGLSLIGAYRGYYHDKTSTMKQGMRYYHSQPPPWLSPNLSHEIKQLPQSKRRYPRYN